MSSNSDEESAHDTHAGLERDTALGAWLHRWTHWGGRGMVLLIDEIRYVYMPFVCCKEAYGYTARLTAIIRQCYLLPFEDLPIAGQYYICWVQPYEET